MLYLLYVFVYKSFVLLLDVYANKTTRACAAPGDLWCAHNVMSDVDSGKNWGNCALRRYDMNGRFQIFSKEMNANRFF